MFWGLNEGLALNILTGVIFVIFLGIYLWDRRNVVINGVLFSLFLVSLYASLGYEAIMMKKTIFLFAFIAITAIGITFLTLGGIGIIIFSFMNSKRLFKKEGFSLHNSLILLVGILTLAIYIILLFDIPKLIPLPLSFISYFFIFCITYAIFMFIQFYISSSLYQIYFPFNNKDFIIVLGSGLIDGDKVSPLLQSRINRAIKFYQKQITKKQKRAKIIFSGGMGNDEKLSEAEAMANYALDNGVLKEDIILEDKSKNTYENMKFSLQEIQKINFGNYKAVYITNDYHLLRAGIYAKKVGLKAQGLGSQTARYFAPNAFIREFLAYMNMYRKVHLIIGLVALVICMIITILQINNII